MTKGDFGVSMVVAPAYLVYLKLSQTLPFFTFGMAEYLLQAMILAAMILLLREFKLSYLFSFVTTILYGLVLDGVMGLLGGIDGTGTALRLVFYWVGLVLCSLGVAFLFHTYLSPAAYELFVKKISQRWQLSMDTFKTVYDCTSCVVAIGISFAFFGLGHFEGVKAGTVVCALLNGFLIGRFGRWFDRHLSFQDRFDFRQYFE